MKLNQYIKESARTAKDMKELNKIHFILGMVGEYLGEVFLESTFANRDKLLEEMGDFMWYYVGYCREYNYTPIIPNKEVQYSTVTLIGELSEYEKKRLVYNKKEDLSKVKNILNSIYANVLATLGGKKEFELCLELNIDKLKKRFPNEFTEKEALERADE